MENGIKMPETSREELEASFDDFYRDNKKLNDVVYDLINRLDKSIKNYAAKGESNFDLRYYTTACKDMSFDERYVYIQHYIKKYIDGLGMEMTDYALHSDEFKVKISTKFKVFKPVVDPIVEEIATVEEVQEVPLVEKALEQKLTKRDWIDWFWLYTGMIFIISAAYVCENYTIVSR